ncbi:MAG: glycine cleavage system aminomethyltransferase GcvT [Mariprofundales bacterium]|nr:glycine cleavage system aminomethyltransferase GcvT [Mariprofundales bacterium]
MTESTLLHTPLFDRHVALGGKIVPFAGYAMPVQYPTGALKEYHATRNDGCAGLFDISHMGQVRVQGADALRFLQFVTTNDVARLIDGQVQYSALLNRAGTFIDDITTYRIHADHYYLCINAANRAKDVAHLTEQAADFDIFITDESDGTTLLALQGEAAERLLQALTPTDLTAIDYYHFVQCPLSNANTTAIISRTGYTGEDGFELYLANGAATTVWDALLEAGASPIGLAARDLLRAEMGYALYGHEISDAVTPVEAKLMWITNMNKGNFIGRSAVVTRKSSGREKALIALKLTARGIPRQHYPVLVDGQLSGEITSGLYSPLTKGGVALAYVAPNHANDGAITVEIRGKQVAAERTTTPFVRSRVKKPQQ